MRSCFVIAGACTALLALALVAPVHAGVVNPDISLIGQPVLRWTDTAGNPAAKRLVLEPGETELMLDAPLNPYARAAAVFAFGGNGVSVEEVYFVLDRGLPAGLALKGGQYRAGFGKLNAQHPHAYVFAERPHVLAAYLPGDESLNETGVQLSEQFGLASGVAFTLSADWLQGDTFRRARAASGAGNDPLAVAGEDGDGDRALEPRPAGLGRASAFLPIGERSGFELGASLVQGTNNVRAAARTALAGGDAKLKYWTSANACLVAQGEFVSLQRDEAGWDEAAATCTKARTTASGVYAFLDWHFDTRRDAGFSFERFQDPDAGNAVATSFGAFAGLALMEETTSFRVGWEHFTPATPSGGPARAAANTFTLRVLYSMGPHKAHQF